VANIYKSRYDSSGGSLLLVLVSGGYVVARRFGLVGPVPELRNGVVTAFEGLPRGSRPVFVVLFVVLGLLGGLWLVAKLGYRSLKWGSRLNSKSGSSSLLIVGVVAGVCMLAVAFGMSLAVLGGTTSMWESDSGAAGTASDLQEAGMSSSLDAAVEGDTLGPASMRSVDGQCSRPSGTDHDGDRLPDAWERRGSTPDGTPLPDADPDRKDLYIQPIYEPGAERFTDEEKVQLRRVWDEMPVTNPSGGTGIELHFVDRWPNQGRVENPITADRNIRSVREEYYTHEGMGGGHCRYHLVAVGTVTSESVAGYGDTPGFVSVVDSTRNPSYNGSVTFRVAVTTHELLHNTAGRVNGNAHPGTGWLGTGGEYLGSGTKQDLDDGFAPPKSYWGTGRENGEQRSRSASAHPVGEAPDIAARSETCGAVTSASP
jgi:hypothetical protein